MSIFRRSAVRFALAVMVLFGILHAAANAHDIPNDVTVFVFARPAGASLKVVVRAPIAAMRDVQFPIRGQQSLDLPRADAAVRDAAMMWLADAVTVYEDERRLGKPVLIAARVSLPSDRSFSAFDSAAAHTLGPPLPGDTDLVWNQGSIDALFEYQIRSDRSRFAVTPEFARLGLRVVTVLRFTTPDGTERAFDLTGDPGLVRLDPRWHQAAWTFVRAGFLHILDGTDHLLFLFCLVLPFRRLKPLVIVVTAFTIAHSLTLGAAALDLGPDALWFPPLVEVLIAASIVYMALENIVGSVHLRQSRWALALLFGLVHGFGFSFALRQTLQFAGSHVVTSLVAFNAGVELGQVAVLIVLVPAVQLLFRYVVAERMGTIVLSAIVAHTGWHWMTERWTALARFDWPAIGLAEVAGALGWLLALLVAAGVVWVLSLAKRIYRPAPQGTER